MAKYVLLEFEDRDELDPDALVESINEYNFGVMVQQDDGTFRPIHPTIGGVYTSIIAIEGKAADL